MRRTFRILIVNPFGIGDVLFTTPLIRAIRRAFPQSRIAYLCNRRTERMLRQNPNLDELFVYEKDEVVCLWSSSRWRCVAYLTCFLGQIRSARFDLVLDLSLGERYSLILALLGITRRIGFNYRRRGRFLTDTLPIDGYHDAHVVEYYTDLLEFMGVHLIEPWLELKVSEEDKEWALGWLREHHLVGKSPIVGIVPAGGVSWGIDAPFRRWSFEGFAAVGDALVKRWGAKVILFGEASDIASCRTVARLMCHPVIDISGQTSLGQFVSLLGRLDLVVCNDGGPLHLAVSQRVSTVSIFGPVDPAVYGPYPHDETKHHVVRQETLPCRPCYHAFKLPTCPYERGCLTTIWPEEVIATCATVLDHGCRQEVAL